MGPVSASLAARRAAAEAMVSFRVDTETLERLKVAAKRRKASLSAYCRDVVLAEIGSRREQGTADIYRVALTALEEIEVVKAALIHSMRIVFHQNYNAPVPLSEEEQRLPLAEQEKRLRDPHRVRVSQIFTGRVVEADANKRAKALELLKED